MKAFLFGGAETDIPDRSVGLLEQLIRSALIELQPKHVLHVPFARPHPIPEDKGEWDEGWLKHLLSDTGIGVLDARNPHDIAHASGSVIFISGGPERINLIDTVNKNPQLLQLILNAEYLIGESSGAMALGEYMRISRTDEGMMKAFGVIRNTIIEPHYTERNYKKFLPGDMRKSGMKFGIGIDSATGIIIEAPESPDTWKTIGYGKTYVFTNVP